MAQNPADGMPSAIYELVAFYEIQAAAWKKGYDRIRSLNGTAKCLDYVIWTAPSVYLPYNNETNKFGVTKQTWQIYYGKTGRSLITMTRDEWMHIVKEKFWKENAQCHKFANMECAFVAFILRWGGFDGIKDMINRLRNGADIKDYKFKISSGYAGMAEATHAYSDPMKAYSIMRTKMVEHYFNMSKPGRTHAPYRVGWMKRNALSFTHKGLYVPIVEPKTYGLNSSSSIADWNNAAANEELYKPEKGYFQLIYSWEKGGPTSLISSGTEYNTSGGMTSYDSSSYNGSGSGFNSYNSSLYQSLISSDAKYGNVYKLGNYASQPDAEIEYKQSQNKDDVLNTLVNGAYEKEEIKKCVELISPDKKKNAKNKSEN